MLIRWEEVALGTTKEEEFVRPGTILFFFLSFSRGFLRLSRVWKVIIWRERVRSPFFFFKSHKPSQDKIGNSTPGGLLAAPNHVTAGQPIRRTDHWPSRPKLATPDLEDKKRGENTEPQLSWTFGGQFFLFLGLFSFFSPHSFIMEITRKKRDRRVWILPKDGILPLTTHLFFSLFSRREITFPFSKCHSGGRRDLNERDRSYLPTSFFHSLISSFLFFFFSWRSLFWYASLCSSKIWFFLLLLSFFLFLCYNLL